MEVNPHGWKASSGLTSTADSATEANTPRSSSGSSSVFCTPRSSWRNSLVVCGTASHDSGVSDASYHSTFSTFGSWRHRRMYMLNLLTEEDDYAQLLKSKSLWPVDTDIEQDWSGRGQHTKFEISERDLVNEILDCRDTLGMGATSIVHKVKCKRIFLARKTIFARKRSILEQACAEMAHLQRLNHAHIIRLIGSYTLGREISILMYPAAVCNLEEFHEELLAVEASRQWTDKANSHRGFHCCLTAAVAYLHARSIKHMDIKPQNVLIRLRPSNQRYGEEQSMSFQLYVTDFGITRSYLDPEAAETENPTSFTRRYAAPEVARQEKRGLPADVFSLGCVLLEIYAVQRDIRIRQSVYTEETGRANSSTHFTHLRQLVETGAHGMGSYQANVEAIRAWAYSSLFVEKTPTRLSAQRRLYEGGYLLGLLRAVSQDPSYRPTSSDLSDRAGIRHCCSRGMDALELEEEDITG